MPSRFLAESSMRTIEPSSASASTSATSLLNTQGCPATTRRCSNFLRRTVGSIEFVEFLELLEFLESLMSLESLKSLTSLASPAQIQEWRKYNNARRRSFALCPLPSLTMAHGMKSILPPSHQP